MFFVYILQSKKDLSFYVGSTQSIEKRIYEHNYGRTGYSKYKRPWILVYIEEFITRSESVKRERQIKRKKSKLYIEGLIAQSIEQSRL